MVFAFALIVVALGFAYYKLSSIKQSSGPLNVDFVKTKNDADSVLLTQEGISVLIDAGEEEDAQAILDLISERKVSELDYLIISHGDKDHIGSVKKLLENVKVNRVIAPYYTGNNKYDELISFFKEKEINLLFPTHNTKITLGDIYFVVYPALEKNYMDENNYSLATLVTHENVNMLFAGDAMKKRTLELEMIHWPSIDLYKVPYHGRASSETDRMFKLIRPKYAVVTSSDCDEAVRESADDLDCPLYFSTAEQVSFVSDGKSIERK